MIVQCPDCSTRYQLDPDRVPRQRIRARCPNCRYVFAIDGTLADRAAVTPTGMSAPVRAVRPDDSAGPRSAAHAPIRDLSRPSMPVEPRHIAAAHEASAPTPPVAEPAPFVSHGFDLEIEHHGAASAPKRPEPTVVRHEIEETPVDTVVATAEPRPAPAASAPVAPVAPSATPANDGASAAQKKARRLARALVSDILVYNRDLRDKALAEGTLVQALGHEIKKSFELFKERVGGDVENPRQYFVEALNDILADGQKVF